LYYTKRKKHNYYKLTDEEQKECKELLRYFKERS